MYTNKSDFYICVLIIQAIHNLCMNFHFETDLINIKLIQTQIRIQKHICISVTYTYTHTRAQSDKMTQRYVTHSNGKQHSDTYTERDNFSYVYV